MYADISKPPAPLPQAKPQAIADGITLLPPLSRLGHGPGLVILHPDSDKHLEIVQGVPSVLVKWAEEGYAVIEIQARALKGDVLRTAVEALRGCEGFIKGSKIGLISYDPELWNKVASTLDGSDIVGAVNYTNSASLQTSPTIHTLTHIAANTAKISRNGKSTTYSYPTAPSHLFAVPFSSEFNYTTESVSHTRNLTFLKPLMNGPYFDLEDIWDEHTYYEFADRSVEHTMSTMVQEPYVNHVPTLTGGVGRASLTNFYRDNFIFLNSVDTELELTSRTVGIDRVIDEFIYKFTHDRTIDWLLPGVPPTFKKMEIPFTAVVNIRGDRLYHEHIGWDQGTVLAQLGLMPQYLPFPYPVEGQEEQTNDWQPPAPESISSESCQTNQAAIVDMLSSLQAQLNSLAAQVQTQSSNPQEVTSLPSPVTLIESARAMVNRIDEENSESTPRSSRTAASQNFYGPTCPDYALNVGQLKLRRDSLPLHQRQLQLASIHEDDASEEGDPETQFSISPRTVDKGDPAMLLTFRSVIGLQEAIQLLYVYQEVVGELHPVVDIDALVMQTRSWYADAGAGMWDVLAASTSAEAYELLLILNLCLAIALRADARTGSGNTEGLLRDSFQDAVNAKLAAPANSIKHATIIFLKGWYDFFQDMPRSAWRMCGIAGRMLMELGLHNAEVFKHTLKSETERTEACTLVSSIVILDRQWSYATGLPIHFHEKSFSSISTSSVKNPYLKAMLSFILISDRFSEPISSAAKGEGYNDESSFELMTFQIEQWRKKAVGEHSIAQCHTWQTDPTTRPPTWAILLNLRAESVRSQLLKPFFFSESDIEITKKHVRAAAERVNIRVINISSPAQPV
ncbi:uncharacterized protein FIESC28_09194 [Fusarium coffeatum]|uniref:Xylanolytic transcriptional activator regulatory domain-containing protein n=1 Tax=Fusarium coffeatum TaxID=231269 RepID=A0A366R1Q3_9HYPO|nr:uncharacterized protein FIESC28_09194 [Fusarium coffeatum]RBR11049.1 hypothetical protein FIESC28_09194 [Fusarium coffeatum]